MTIVDHAARVVATTAVAPVVAVRAKLRVSTRRAEQLVAELDSAAGTLFGGDR